MGLNHQLSNYNNLAAVLFLWTILPGYAATAFIPTIVLERPLFVRCAPPCCARQAVYISSGFSSGEVHFTS